jgi:peptidoglycan/LPS O-acetylase OafA/YrhL
MRAAVPNQCEIPLTQSPFRGHIAELDAIRAFGMLWVVLAHFWPSERLRPMYDVWQLGWSAMDAFFVLSGFLVAGILLDTRERPGFFRNFYIRRALRILPLYYLVITALTVAALIHDGGESYRKMADTWGSPAWFFAYVGNIPLAARGAQPPIAGFIPLWSLQIEEQFYLLFPWMVYHLRVSRLRRLLWAMVVVSPILRIVFYFAIPDNAFPQQVLLPCRMEGFALGGLIAIRFRQGDWNIDTRRLGWLALGLLALTVGLGASTAGTQYGASPFNRTLGNSISSFGWACLVVWLIVMRGSARTGWLRNPAVQYFATISYGVYLIHFPVGSLVQVIDGIPAAEPLGFAHLLIVMALSIAAAAVSWHLLEAPMLRLKDRLAPGGRTPMSSTPVTAAPATTGLLDAESQQDVTA